MGENNFAGLMAYYIKSIDIVNHKIYLSDIQNVCPEISENDYTDINFETPAYEIGDKFDLIVKAYETYREQFHFISTILKIENNVVYYGADNEGNGAELPITAIYEDTVEYAQTFFVSSKPNIGLVNIGGYSNVEGDSNYASGKWSHAEGWNSLAAGRFSHVEGRDGRAAYAAHAEGYNCNADGNYSHAEGDNTSASGTSSHTEGSSTKASGNGSHAEGYWTYASSDYQHVQGKYNIEDTENKYAHIVGNGTVSNRSNAHTLDWSGNACYSGDVYVNGADAETGKKLATEEFVDSKISNSSGVSIEVVSFTMNTAGWIDNVYQKIEELYPGTQYDVEVFFDGKNGNKTTKQYYDNMELTGSPDNNYLYCYGSYDDNEDDLIILENGVPLILKVVKK